MPAPSKLMLPSLPLQVPIPLKHPWWCCALQVVLPPLLGKDVFALYPIAYRTSCNRFPGHSSLPNPRGFGNVFSRVICSCCNMRWRSRNSWTWAGNLVLWFMYPYPVWESWKDDFTLQSGELNLGVTEVCLACSISVDCSKATDMFILFVRFSVFQDRVSL